MKTIKTSFAVILSAFVLLAATSCQKEDVQPTGTTSLVLRAGTAPAIASLKNAPATGVVIESFKINIREIELELDDSDTDAINTGVRYSDEIELYGPFEVDLMTNGTPLATTLTTTASLPVGLYEEVAFEFNINRNPLSTMYQKSVLVEGTINGTPFVFHTREEFEVEIEFEHPITIADAQQAAIAISFDLTGLLDPARGGVDISNAVDKDLNGTIVINYDDTTDSNNDLADLIEDRLDDIIYSYEEEEDGDNGDDY